MFIFSILSTQNYFHLLPMCCHVSTQLLFISYKLYHIKDIQSSTISTWIKSTAKFCYTKMDDADMDLIGAKAYHVRLFAASKVLRGVSIDQITNA